MSHKLLYQSLQISENSSLSEIKKSYKNLLKIYHPDKNVGNENPKTVDKFNEIQLAYEILSHPNKRKYYDFYGDSLIENDVVELWERDFDKFSGKSSNDSGLETGFQSQTSQETTSNKVTKSETTTSGNPPETCQPKVTPQKLTKSTQTLTKTKPLQLSLKITLEEAKYGTHKKIYLTKSLLGIEVKSNFVLRLAPNIKEHSKIIRENSGNQNIGQLPGDLIFVIKFKQHETFEYKSQFPDNLYFTQTISLSKALSCEQHLFLIPILRGPNSSDQDPVTSQIEPTSSTSRSHLDLIRLKSNFLNQKPE